MSTGCGMCGVPTPRAEQFLTATGVLCGGCHGERHLMEAAPPTWPRVAMDLTAGSVEPALVTGLGLSLAQAAAQGGMAGAMAYEMVLILSIALAVGAVAMTLAGVAGWQKAVLSPVGQLEPARVRRMQAFVSAWWAANGLGGLALLLMVGLATG